MHARLKPSLRACRTPRHRSTRAPAALAAPPAARQPRQAARRALPEPLQQPRAGPHGGRRRRLRRRRGVAVGVRPPGRRQRASCIAIVPGGRCVRPRLARVLGSACRAVAAVVVSWGEPRGHKTLLALSHEPQRQSTNNQPCQQRGPATQRAQGMLPHRACRSPQRPVGLGASSPPQGRLGRRGPPGRPRAPHPPTCTRRNWPN